MKVVVASVGRSRGGPEQMVFERYLQRISWSVELREHAPKGGKVNGRQKEATALLKGIPKEAFVIALDSSGESMTSRAFAHKLLQVQEQGTRMLAFLIGGPDGHGDSALTRANMSLSLGTMTWPHLLVRAMLAEQLWRATSIISGHPYHRA